MLSESKLFRLVENSKGTNPYEPFPGKIPVKLFVQICVLDPENEATYTRYKYHGKWSYEAIRAAIRVFNSLRGHRRNSCIVVYCKSGLLFNGDLIKGYLYPSWERAFLSKRSGGEIAVKAWPIANASKYLRPTQTIRMGARTVLWNEETPMPNKAIVGFCNEVFRQRRRGW